MRRSVPTRPVAVLTGDTLFVGDVGRPDLRASLGWSATDLGNLLFDSLHGKLLKLPDASLVYPAHGAGSLCGRALSQETVSTIGEQRRVNYALRPMSKAEFVALVTADQPEAPPYFTYDAVLNSKERPTLDETLAREVQPIPPAGVLALQEAGAQVLDTRDAGEFASAHLKGSINVGLGGQYATWAGTVLRHEKPIVIVAAPGFEHESAVRLGRIGFDNVVGYLQGGLASLADRPELVGRTDTPQPGGCGRAQRRRHRGGRADPARARRGRHCRQHLRPAHPARAQAWGDPARPAADRALRRRLPIVDRGQRAEARRVRRCVRDRRWHDRVAGGRSARGRVVRYSPVGKTRTTHSRSSHDS